jgi:glycerophosphoryl diester phosphodiesterase
MGKPFYILGHKGSGNSQFYQNSYSAFREALSAADGLETDAVLSSDGVVFLIHETFFLHKVEYTLKDHLDPASAEQAGDRRLDQMTAREIETFRLKNGEPIPRFDRLLEMMRDFPHAILNIELKADKTALPVVDQLRRAMVAGQISRDRIIVSSFNHPALLQVREEAPEFKIGALFSMETQTRSLLYPWSNNTVSCYTPFDRAKLDEPMIRCIGPEYFNLALPTLSISNIAAVHAAFPKAQFMTWAIYEPKAEEIDTVSRQLQHLADDGLLHSWITDEPRLRKSQSPPQSPHCMNADRLNLRP